MAKTSVLGDVAVYLGLLAALIQLVDFFFSDKSKRHIHSALLVIWVWLAEQRIGQFLLILQNTSFVRWTFVALSLVPLSIIIYVVASTLAGPFLIYEELVFTLFGFLPGAAIAFGLLAYFAVRPISSVAGWIVERQRPMSTLARISIVPVSGVCVGGTILFAMAHISWSAWQGFAMFAILGFVGAPTVVFTLTGVVLLAWFIALGGTDFILRLFELIVRRVAESPKGPVLAVAGLLGIFGTILKAMAGK
jgi:hypothetical protein